MISLKEIESIHEILIDKFGGAKGIRDRGILESALNRPYQTSRRILNVMAIEAI
jgi:death-on-curing protein